MKPLACRKDRTRSEACPPSLPPEILFPNQWHIVLFRALVQSLLVALGAVWCLWSVAVNIMNELLLLCFIISIHIDGINNQCNLAYTHQCKFESIKWKSVQNNGSSSATWNITNWTELNLWMENENPSDLVSHIHTQRIQNRFAIAYSLWACRRQHFWFVQRLSKRHWTIGWCRCHKTL